ncbi:hypothetical protein [Roseibium sp. SCP14]|uniref:hypothetical protein n=1 Tax=Roseibium sp. SCP14 TaxID=3141375 RepID=UPI00333B21AA
MDQKTNVISQAFGALQACRSLVLTYLGVTCGIDVLSERYESEWFWDIPSALVGAVFVYHLCINLLGLEPETGFFGKSQRQFVLRYILLLFLPSFLMGWGIVLSVEMFPEDFAYQSTLFVSVLTGLFVSFILPLFLFGSALPAQLLEIQPQIISSIHRAGRQAGYLLTRMLFLLVPAVLVSTAIFLVFEFTELEMMPINAAGEVNVVGGLLLLISNLIGALCDALLSVIICNAYIKDLREQGELPLAEAEVFA